MIFMSEDQFSEVSFQVKYLGKVLDALFMMIQDDKVLADFDSPCSLPTSNVKVKYKNQRHYGMYSVNSFGVRSCF